MMAYISSIFCVLFLFVLVTGSQDKECTTFSTNGSISNTFEYYRFYDFRNVYNGSSISVNSSDTNALATSRTVNDTSWTNDWNIRVQSKAAANDDAIPLKYISSNVQLGMVPLPNHLFSLLKSPKLNASLQKTAQIPLQTIPHISHSPQTGSNLPKKPLRLIIRVRIYLTAPCAFSLALAVLLVPWPASSLTTTTPRSQTSRSAPATP